MRLEFSRWFLLLALSQVLASCGGGTSNDTADTRTFTIGGSVSGLRAGGSLEIRNSGIDGLDLTQNGNFEFKQRVDFGGSYSITLILNPSGQVCTIENASGSNVVADINSVNVRCVNAAQVGGVVAGLLPGKEVVLAINGLDRVSVSSDGDFTFKAPVAYGEDFRVTITSQPAGQSCSVSNGFGTAFDVGIINVHVSCGTAGNSISIGASLSPANASALNVQVQSTSPISEVSVTLNGISAGTLSGPNQYCGWHGHFISWSCDQKTFPYNAYLFTAMALDIGCRNNIAVKARDASGHHNSLIIAPCLSTKP